MARIMVADDEPDVVELLTFILEKEGHEVLSAANGREALSKILEQPPDLLIL
ncbi:MAG: response regulator, partial [Elusimicrobia bacterium]|nr:response regulator [Elusimicrobiota bacterium]